MSDPPAAPPTTLDLLLGFARVSAFAFGGVLPWARYVLVERRRWLTGPEFTDALALAQLLPGPNIVNLSVAIGARFRGPAGAVAALTGMMAAPVVVVLLLATLYARFADLPAVGGALRGMAAAAAGLVIATAVRMAEPMLRARARTAGPVIAGVFALVGLAGWPLWGALLVAAPAAVALEWRFGRAR